MKRRRPARGDADRDHKDWLLAFARKTTFELDARDDGHAIAALSFAPVRSHREPWAPPHPEQIEVESLHERLLAARRAFLERVEERFEGMDPVRARWNTVPPSSRRDPSPNVVAADFSQMDLALVRKHDRAILRIAAAWQEKHRADGWGLFLHHELTAYMRQLLALYSAKVAVSGERAGGTSLPAPLSAGVVRDVARGMARTGAREITRARHARSLEAHLLAAIKRGPGSTATDLEGAMRADGHAVRNGALANPLKKLVANALVVNRGTRARPRYYSAN